MDYLNRKLGLSEKLFDILHDVAAITLVNLVRIEGPVTPDTLQKALDLLQKRHPILQVHIVESTDGAYFQSEGTPKIPMRVIEKKHENQWLEIAEDELHTKFSGDIVPLCRVTFIRSFTKSKINEIIVTFHHAIADGISCMNFIHELLSYCQKIAIGEQISEVVAMQALPPLENLLKNSPSQNQLEQDQQKFVREIHKPKLIIEGEVAPSHRRTCLLNKFLNQEMTHMLKSRCKKEKTTVYGALCAAMLFEAAKIGFTDTPINLSYGTNVNLRKYCDPEVRDDYIGFFASRVKEICTLDEKTLFWDLARECKLKISYSITCQIPQSIMCSDYLRNINKDFIVNISDYELGRTTIINLSNLGQFNFSARYGDFEIKELYFAAGEHLIGAWFWLGAVTFHDQLFCTFAHVVPLVSVEVAKLFADSVMTTIQQACGEQSLIFSFSS